jgi:hypothetical protein
MKKHEITITRHVVERYYSKFIKTNKYDHIYDCRFCNCKVCDNLKKQLFEEVYDQFDMLKESVSELILDSEIEKSIYNNTNYMNYLYEKYGFDNIYEFYLNKNGIVFVCKLENGKKVFMTCYSTNGSKFSIRKKYKKDESKFISP